MQFLYCILFAAVFGTYALACLRVLRFSTGLNAICGWMAGIGYFALAPLGLITVAGVYKLPAKYDVGQTWGTADLSNVDYLLSYLMVWTTLMLMCIAVLLFAGHESTSPGIDLRVPLERVLGITITMLMLEWLMMIRLAGGLEEFLASHWYQRSEGLAAQFGDRFVLLSHWLQATDIIFVSAAAWYTNFSLQFGKIKKRFIFLVLLFLTLQMVITGNRIYIVIYALAFLASCGIVKKPKPILWMLLGSPVLLFVLSGWGMARHDLTAIPDSVAAFSGEQEESSTISSLMDATEGLDFLLALHIVQDYGPQREFLYGETYLKTVTAWVPRSLYPTKPENFTVLIAKEYLPNQDTSLNATALGEMYANFGPFVLLLFPLLTAGVIGVNRWVERHREAHPLFPILFFVLAVWMVRTAFADTVVLGFMSMLQIAVLRVGKVMRPAIGKRSLQMATP